MDFQQINKDYKRATEDKITKEDQIEPLPKEDFCDVDIDPEQRKVLLYIIFFTFPLFDLFFFFERNGKQLE